MKKNSDKALNPIRHLRFWNKDQGLIEVNDECNIMCRGCYKPKTSQPRALAAIYKDIDDLAKVRRPNFIAIAGGEPTLFKQLPEVIRYASTKFKKVVILTNGTTLNYELLSLYQRNGLTCILIHIDSHQRNRPDILFTPTCEKDLDELRLQYTKMCADAGVQCGFLATLYPDSIHDSSAMLDLCTSHSHAHINGTITFLYSPSIDLHTHSRTTAAVTNRAVAQFLYNKHNIKPFFYLPSNKDKNKWCWISYIAFITHGTRGIERLYLDPSHRIFGHLSNAYLYITKNYNSLVNLPKPLSIISALISYLFLCFSITTIFKTVRFLSICIFNRHLTLQYFIFQQPPTFTDTTPLDEIEICENCPDARMRDGVLLPICLGAQAQQQNKGPLQPAGAMV